MLKDIFFFAFGSEAINSEEDPETAHELLYNHSIISNAINSTSIRSSAIKSQIDAQFFKLSSLVLDLIKFYPDKDRRFVRNRWRVVKEALGEIMHVDSIENTNNSSFEHQIENNTVINREETNAIKRNEFCRGSSQYLDGKWIRRNGTADNNSPTKKRFHCCVDSPTKENFPPRYDICGNVSQIMNNYVIGSNELLTQFGGNACTCDRVYGYISFILYICV
jgi:hypothetical protein